MDWLDRFSAYNPPPQSYSNPQSRSYSPAPRRPNNLNSQPSQSSQRPPFNPRTSSLSNIQNESSYSLLDASKTNRVPAQSDPLDVLNRLLGGAPKDGSKGRQASSALPDDKLEDIDFGGLSLLEFARSGISTEDDSSQQLQSLEEYGQETAKYNELHDSIRACDAILSSVEVNLTQFQNDLGAVSAEIETLQARSTALSLRLENRKAVEAKLGPIVEEITISPAVVVKISEGAIDDAWIAALNVIEKRSKSVNAKTEELGNVKAALDLKPLLEQLVAVAIERIRDFLVAQIKALRSPNINAQIIQQQHFIRYKDLYAFLRKHHEVLAEEIGQAYMNTMRWYYLTHFTRYEKALAKVKLHTIAKHDTLGAEDAPRKSGLLSGSKTPMQPHDAFNIGRRNDVLIHSNQPAVPSHLAEEDQGYHYIEFSFRNFNLALIDNASAEYSFLNSFFAPALSMQNIARYFNYIFAPTFDLGLHLTKSLVTESFDCLGLLLCVRLNQKFNFKLQRHKVPVVDGYINQTSMLLWPRFQVVMDVHCESIKKLTSSLPSGSPSSKSELAKQSAAPHAMTQRFGQFLKSILDLSIETGDDEPVSSSLARLRSETEGFLVKFSKTIGDKRKRERFLVNNYSLILTIIGDEGGKLAGEQRAHFEELKGALEDSA